MPRIVKPPLPFSPHACLVTGSADGEFIDFERDFIGMDPRIVLRKEVVEEAARDCCGMTSTAEVDALRLRVEGYEDKIRELSADLDVIKAFEERFGQSLEAGVTAGVQAETASPAGPMIRTDPEVPTPDTYWITKEDSSDA